MYKYLYLGLIIFAISSCSKPEVTFTFEQMNDMAPAEVKFSNSSLNCESFTWFFGDGTMSDEMNPSHTYDKFGDIMVVLEGRKGRSSARDTQFINIKEPPRQKVRIETQFGVMIAELLNATPLHRDNFIKLTREGYYDGLLFHRVMQGFMIQGGDPLSRDAPLEQQLGMGGPGYKIPAEFGQASHYKGALAAARQPDQANPRKESSGSQFYIVQGEKFSSMQLLNIGSQLGITFSEEDKKKYAEIGGYPPLDGQYTVFGNVIEGLDVIDKIAAVETNSADRPLEDIVMKISLIEDENI